MPIKTKYEATDGKCFSTLKEAEAYEETLNGNEALKKEVIEQLSKLAIKLKSAKPGSTQTAVYLHAVNEIVIDLITGDSSTANQYIEDYYNSNMDC